MPSIERGLVYWLNDKKTGLVSVESINEENRTPGQIGPVLWTDGNRYPAQIIKISKCILTLERAEGAFMKKMASLKDKGANSSKDDKASKKRVSNRTNKATTQVSGAATDVQIAKALGEKVKITNPKLSAESEAQKKEREAKVAAEKTVREMDESALTSTPNIFAVNSARRNLSVSLGESSVDQARSKPADQLIIDNGDDSDDSTTKVNDESLIICNRSDSEDEADDMEPCHRCRPLAMAVNHGTVTEFVGSLASFCNLPTSELPEVMVEVNAGDEVVRYLKPIPVPPGHKKVELAVGSGLFLKKAKKSQLVVDAANDPYKLTRITLCTLYGPQLKLKGISAKARGAERLGIEESDLTNIFNFVCRNADVKTPPCKDKKGNQRASFNYATFIKEVNRKLKSSSRVRGKKQTQSGGANSAAKKSPLRISPGKKSPAKKSPAKKSPAKRSPWKEAKSPGKNSVVHMGLNSAGTPKKDWEVTSLSQMGRLDAFYVDPNPQYSSSWNNNYPSQSSNMHSAHPTNTNLSAQSNNYCAPSTSSGGPYAGYSHQGYHGPNDYYNYGSYGPTPTSVSQMSDAAEGSHLLDVNTIMSL